MITTPKDFTDRFPNYVYRNGKGNESVQWREAALDMANDRDELVRALEAYFTNPDRFNKIASDLLKKHGK